MIRTWLAASIACVVLAAPAWSAEKAKPAAKARDCSAEPAPDGKLVLRIDGQAIPLTVAAIRSQQKMSIGGDDEGDAPKESFEVFGISLRDAESIFPPHEVEISVMVVEGQPLDGKTFRRLPVDDMKLQPTPVKAEGDWMPEIQSVEVASQPDDIDYEHGVLASVRVEFGQRNGDVQPGKLRLCIAPGQTDATFLPEPTRAIVVEGAFEAKQGL
jgi:hypothetical protein